MKTLTRYFCILTCITVIHFGAFGQNLDYVRSLIDTLASPSFHGRGYAFNGDKLAADYITGELKQMGIKPVSTGFFQPFNIDVNTFTGGMQMIVDNDTLKAGKDFMVMCSSPAINGVYKPEWVNQGMVKTEKGKKKFNKKNLSSKVVVLDTNYTDMEYYKIFTAPVLIMTSKGKLMWDVSDGQEVVMLGLMNVSREKITPRSKKIQINFENDFKQQYKTQNIIAYIPGKTYADSFFVFTAHYDHLGHMGKDVYFPGAHDNASGTAMLLDLAKYYAKPENQPEYSVCFMFFSGEELGLMGSTHYTNNPLFPLKTIKLLINLDMVSTGSDGIKVVNGSVFKKEFDKLVSINDQKQYLKTVSPRGAADNSDHAPFYKKGVPSLYIYTLGNEWKEYHSVDDKADGLPMTKYNDLFHLVTDFIKEEMHH